MQICKFSGVNKSSLIRVFLLLFYIILVTTAGIYHEPWRDEIDTWLITKYATYEDFISYFSHSGHPPLWYLINLFFSRILELPITSQKILPIVFSSLLVWIFLFKSKLQLWFITPTILSAYIAYQNGVIARGYVVILLIIAFIAFAHEQRIKKPLTYSILIALLYQTEIWAWCIAGMLTLFFFIDIINNKNHRAWLGFSLQVISAIIVIVLVYPKSNGNPIRTLFEFSWSNYKGAIIDGYFPIFSHHNQLNRYGLYVPLLFSSTFQTYYLVFGIAIQLALAIILRKSRLGILVIVNSTWFFFMFSYVYGGSFWHHSLLPILQIFCIWLARSDKALINTREIEIFKLLMLIPIFTSCIVSFVAFRYDIQLPYSGGKEAANFILRNAKSYKPLIVSLGCDHEKSVSAYLPNAIVWMAGYNTFSRYHTWDISYYYCERKDRHLLAKNSLIRFKDSDEIWLVSVLALKFPDKLGLSVEFYSPGLTEGFWVYRYKKI
jgi:hypothetical protein